MRRQRGENTLSSRNMPFALKNAMNCSSFHSNNTLTLKPDLALKIQIFENSMKYSWGNFEVFLKKVFANYIAAKMLENKPSGYEKTGILFIVK